MNRAEKNVKHIREIMASANPVPVSAFTGGWNDELGQASFQQIHLERERTSGIAVPVDAGAAGDPGETGLLSVTDRRTGRRGADARRWLLPAAAAAAVIAIVLGAWIVVPR
ncbi:MAG: hypothetical protein M3Z75_26280, partial [Actinomycetota bacterium]|nr:hypothetical protein [Actinomycetota bacterium]